MQWQWIVSAVMALGVVLLCAFRAGKLTGYKAGYARATAEAPLLMRLKALERGHCPVCDERNATWYNVAKEVVE
jgi:hypothetical protein